MKKLLIIIIIASCFLSKSSAQDKFINHLAIGINIGTTSMRAATPFGYFPLLRQTDGVGIEAAAQFTDWLDTRVGFSMTMSGNGSGTFGIEGITDGKFQSSNIHISHKYNVMAGSLMFDFYPFKKTTFHFTAGLFAGSGTLLHIHNSTPVPEALASYDKGIVEMHGVTIPTDKDGKIDAKVKIPAVRPYVGIGIGRPFDRRVNVTADLGIMYKGRNGLTVSAPDGSRVEADYWRSNSYISRMVRWNKKCIIAPLLSVRLFVKIF